MMQLSGNTLGRALGSGTLAGLGAMAAAALAGRRETGSWLAPLNATSHLLWGDAAAKVNNATLRHTLPGLAINHASAIFWAALYEKFFGGKVAERGHVRWLRPLWGSALISTTAYVTDYYLMPKRLTPGYELRLSRRSLAAVFGALALGMAARDLLQAVARR